jgi:hypothetical protein
MTVFLRFASILRLPRRGVLVLCLGTGLIPQCIGRSNLRFSPSQTIHGLALAAPRPAARPVRAFARRRPQRYTVLASLGYLPKLSLAWAFGPCSPIRRVLHDGQTPRLLQEKAIRKSCPHSSQKARAKPWTKIPHVRYWRRACPHRRARRRPREPPSAPERDRSLCSPAPSDSARFAQGVCADKCPGIGSPPVCGEHKRWQSTSLSSITVTSATPATAPAKCIFFTKYQLCYCNPGTVTTARCRPVIAPPNFLTPTAGPLPQRWRGI